MGCSKASREYRKVVEIVKSHAKTRYPMKIRRQQISKNVYGYCMFDEDYQCFIIQINRDLPYHFAIETLLHECAHAMAWDKDQQDHGLNWGKAYSKIYRIYLKEFFGIDD